MLPNTQKKGLCQAQIILRELGGYLFVSEGGANSLQSAKTVTLVEYDL